MDVIHQFWPDPLLGLLLGSIGSSPPYSCHPAILGFSKKDMLGYQESMKTEVNYGGKENKNKNKNKKQAQMTQRKLASCKGSVGSH